MVPVLVKARSQQHIVAKLNGFSGFAVISGFTCKSEVSSTMVNFAKQMCTIDQQHAVLTVLTFEGMEIQRILYIFI